MSSQIVVFDYAAWQAQFPEFSAVSPTMADGYFTVATTILNNSACSAVQDLALRTSMLNMLTAHVAALIGPGASGIVGRISNATEGSVSVAADFPTNPSGAWFMQTPYGALYWQMTASFRTMRYVPSPGRFMGPLVGYPFGRRW